MTGGKISLVSGGTHARRRRVLTAHAEQFSSAGKGGEIRLEAGAAVDGVANLAALLDLQSGAIIDLGVDSFVAGTYTTPGSSAFNGQFTGTLHLRAPRNAANTDVVSESGRRDDHGRVEHSRRRDSKSATSRRAAELSPAGAPASPRYPDAGTVQRAVFDSANAFLSGAEITTRWSRDCSGRFAGIGARISCSRPASRSSIAPATSPSVLQRQLDGNRQRRLEFGGLESRGLPLRPAKRARCADVACGGQLMLLNALSDGFRRTPWGAGSHRAPERHAGRSIALAQPAHERNDALPVNTQSWSFRIAAGADLGAADFHAVQPLTTLASDMGSVQLGKFYSPGLVVGHRARPRTRRSTTATRSSARARATSTSPPRATCRFAISLPPSTPRASVCRIRRRSSRPDDFVVSARDASRGTRQPNQGSLGAYQQIYTPQWSLAGGDVTICRAGGHRASDDAQWGDRRGFLAPDAHELALPPRFHRPGDRLVRRRRAWMAVDSAAVTDPRPRRRGGWISAISSRASARSAAAT